MVDNWLPWISASHPHLAEIVLVILDFSGVEMLAHGKPQYVNKLAISMAST
ncbi:hypothetical protein TSUD_92520 [Trifolium subterraneum]|uniref:Uncharacterized protein n=1 Tax=Trifolium subterraneum TaxID=3900 RepID=A0A2Z6P0Z9_TRISU|nr:hypothetical protein TSUD_92520 [Trifolium subterraneum]